MSTKIIAQTSEWGKKEAVHLEIDWNGQMLMITVDNDKIIIHTIYEIKVEQEALNYVEISK